MKAVCDLNRQVFVIYPNADAGGREMIEVIKKYEKYRNIHTFQNLAHTDFLNLLKISSVLVGNSSSGIIEAPSFGVPTVNIGSRQKGRLIGENIIEAGYNSDEIASAVDRALNDNDFKRKVKTACNPYGVGDSSRRIVEILQNIVITPDLLQKRMMY
jgi:UDP-hydrolysing UDP-N-acetyl-D-glucosamine 2-epimerase